MHFNIKNFPKEFRIICGTSKIDLETYFLIDKVKLDSELNQVDMFFSCGRKFKNEIRSKNKIIIIIINFNHIIQRF